MECPPNAVSSDDMSSYGVSLSCCVLPPIAVSSHGLSSNCCVFRWCVLQLLCLPTVCPPHVVSSNCCVFRRCVLPMLCPPIAVSSNCSVLQWCVPQLLCPPTNCPLCVLPWCVLPWCVLQVPCPQRCPQRGYNCYFSRKTCPSKGVCLKTAREPISQSCRYLVQQLVEDNGGHVQPHKIVPKLSSGVF